MTTPDPVCGFCGEGLDDCRKGQDCGLAQPASAEVRPMPTVDYDGKTYKLRSRKTQIPDLGAMTDIGALVWLLRNTYPKGTNHRRPTPNIGGLNLEVQ